MVKAQRQILLSTSRLRLTTWLLRDAEDLYTVHRDPETMRFVRHGRPETLTETRELVEAYITEHTSHGWTRWRLTDHRDHLIGRAGFTEHGGGPELGYTILRELWGRGLATEIVLALVAWHRAHLALFGGAGLTAHAALGNRASMRVLEKAGFSRTGEVEIAGTGCASYRAPSSIPAKPGDDSVSR